jgi:hypothetical protein
VDTKHDKNTGAVGRPAIWRRPLSGTATAEVRNRRLAHPSQMTHPSIRQLFDYWNERRGRRLAPERGDIEPNDIRSALADSFVLSFDPGRGYPFRIAGTRVCALFRRELKGERFLDLWSAMSRNDIRTLLASVRDQSVGVIAGAAAAGIGDARLALDLLVLPLSHHLQTNARLLGALVPSEPPPWLGAHTLSDLTIETHRYIRPPALLPIQPHVPMPHGRLQRLRPSADRRAAFTAHLLIK